MDGTRHPLEEPPGASSRNLDAMVPPSLMTSPPTPRQLDMEASAQPTSANPLAPSSAGASPPSPQPVLSQDTIGATASPSDEFGDFVDADDEAIFEAMESDTTPTPFASDPLASGSYPLSTDPLSATSVSYVPTAPLSPRLPAPPPPLKAKPNNHIADILSHDAGGLSLFSSPEFRERKEQEGLPSPPPAPPPKSPLFERVASNSSATPQPAPHPGLEIRDPRTPPNTALLPHPLAPSPSPSSSPSPIPSASSPRPHTRSPPRLTTRSTEQDLKGAKGNAADENAIIAKHLGMIDDGYFVGREPAEALDIPVPISRTRSRSGGSWRARDKDVSVVESSREGEGQGGVEPPKRTNSYGTLSGLWGLWKGAESPEGGAHQGPLSTQPSSSHADHHHHHHHHHSQSHPQPHPPSHGHSHPHVAGIFTTSPPPIQPTIVEGSASTFAPSHASTSTASPPREDDAHVRGVTSGRPLPRARTSLESIQAKWLADTDKLTPPVSSWSSRRRSVSPDVKRGERSGSRTPIIEGVVMNHSSPFAPSVSPSQWVGASAGLGDGSMSSASAIGSGPRSGAPGLGLGGAGGTIGTGNPFGTHTFVPIPGAPGFKPEEYDWDKGFSDDLEREIGEGSSSTSPRAPGLVTSPSGSEKSSEGWAGEKARGRQERSERKKEKESSAPLYQTISSKLGFGWGSASSSPSTSSRSAYQHRNTVPALRSTGEEKDKRRSATEPRRAVGEVIERMVGGVELKGRRETTVPVLSEKVSNLLRPYLPPLSRLPRSWTLLYSLDQHGISLNTLYTKCEAPEKTRKTGQPFVGMNGAIFVINDSEAISSLVDGHEEKSVFGAFVAEGIGRKAKGFYGGGDSFLFSYSPSTDSVKVYKPTGRNSYFAICDSDYVGFGGGGTKYGLWVDAGLLEGSSARSVTFGNEVLCSVAAAGEGGPPNREGAGGEVEFEVVGLEVWGIGPT